jgi:putative ABC transport system permease protein
MRNRLQTLINIIGLAIGISFSIIIFLYAHKEISYDRFHNNASRIYRIGIDGRIAENKLHVAVTSNPLAGRIKKDIPEVQDAIRVARFGAWLVRNDSIGFNEDNLIFTDPGFFTMFSFPLLKGEPAKALSKPKSLVLSESASKRYFGNDNPMGKKLRIENDTVYYTVTGVMKDIPENSHIHFDMVGTISTFDKLLHDDRWIINYLYTYILVKPNVPVANVRKGLEKIVDNYIIPDYQKFLKLEDQQSFTENNYYHLELQPLTDIHLESRYGAEFEPVGKLLYVYLFIILALFILILSCMNFMSLVTAQSINRAREVGIRKISGSEKSNLVQQFLLESSLLAFFAMALGLLFTELALPAFSNFIGLQLSLGLLLNSSGLILLIALVLVIGIISGLYPAWYLSNYNPTSVLRNNFNDHPDKGHFRKGLTVVQIFLAVGAVSMALIVMYQYKFLVNKDRGYDTDNLLVIRRPDALTNKLEDFKKQIIAHPNILAAANATSAMGSGFPRFPYYLEGRPLSQNYSVATLLVSYGFDSTYRIAVSDGRFLDPRFGGDSSACVINETAVRTIGIDNPVGKTLNQLSDKPGKVNKYTIVGVVKDFYFETLENPVRPLILILMPGNFEGYLSVRITPENHDSSVQFLKKVWENYTNAYPFVYYFLDEDRMDYYKPVRTTARIFILLSIVNIIMACLSLFALVSFTYQKKKREIGIQKAMGASNFNIVLHRATEIVWLVLGASVFSWIGVYFLAWKWLEDYAYHIHLNSWYFLISTACILILSLATVYYHTQMAVKASPGAVLKYE